MPNIKNITLCVCVSVCVYVWVYVFRCECLCLFVGMQACMYMHVCEGPRTTLVVMPSSTIQSFLEAGSLTGIKHSKQVKLSSHQSPRIGGHFPRAENTVNATTPSSVYICSWFLLGSLCFLKTAYSTGNHSQSFSKRYF